MTNEEKRVKLHNLRAYTKHLNICIGNADIAINSGTDDDGMELIFLAEGILRKAYDLYPEVYREFQERG